MKAMMTTLHLNLITMKTISTDTLLLPPQSHPRSTAVPAGLASVTTQLPVLLRLNVKPKLAPWPRYETGMRDAKPDVQSAGRMLRNVFLRRQVIPDVLCGGQRFLQNHWQMKTAPFDGRLLQSDQVEHRYTLVSSDSWI
jgi:hypothetical protein